MEIVKDTQATLVSAGILREGQPLHYHARLFLLQGIKAGHVDVSGDFFFGFSSEWRNQLSAYEFAHGICPLGWHAREKAYICATAHHDFFFLVPTDKSVPRSFFRSLAALEVRNSLSFSRISRPLGREVGKM